MSEAATPAAPAAPSAPVESNGQPAPAEVDPLAEFDNVLKKSPLKYKSNGKEHVVQSAADIRRKLEKVHGIEARAQELTEREAKASEVLALKQRIRESKDSKERIALLRELAGETFDEAAEEAIMERIEREKSMSNLTPGERQAREEAAQLKARIEKYEAQEKQAAEERQRQEEETEFGNVRQQIAGLAVKALTAAKLPKEAAPDAGRRLAALMERAASRGLPLDPADLSTEAVKWAGEDFRSYTTPLDGDALIDFLGEAVVQKASRAWLARVQGGNAPRAVVPTPKVETQSERRGGAASPMAAWNDLARGKL